MSGNSGREGGRHLDDLSSVGKRATPQSLSPKGGMTCRLRLLWSSKR